MKVDKTYSISKLVLNLTFIFGSFYLLMDTFGYKAAFGFYLLGAWIRFKTYTEIFERFGDKE